MVEYFYISKGFTSGLFKWDTGSLKIKKADPSLATDENTTTDLEGFLKSCPSETYYGRCPNDNLTHYFSKNGRKPTPHKLGAVGPELPLNLLDLVNTHVYTPQEAEKDKESEGVKLMRIVAEATDILLPFFTQRKPVRVFDKDTEYIGIWEVYGSGKADGTYTFLSSWTKKLQNSTFVWNPTQKGSAIRENVLGVASLFDVRIFLNQMVPGDPFQVLLTATGLRQTYSEYMSQISLATDSTFMSDVVKAVLHRCIQTKRVDSLGDGYATLSSVVCGVSHKEYEGYVYSDKDWWLTTQPRKQPHIIRKYLKRALCPEYLEAAAFSILLREPKKTCVMLAGCQDTAKSTLLKTLLSALNATITNSFEIIPIAQGTNSSKGDLKVGSIAVPAPLGNNFVSDYTEYFRAPVFTLNDYNYLISTEDDKKLSSDMIDIKTMLGEYEYDLNKKYATPVRIETYAQWLGSTNKQLFDDAYFSACATRFKFVTIPFAVPSESPDYLSKDEMIQMKEEVIDWLLSDCREAYYKLSNDDALQSTFKYMFSYSLFAINMGLASTDKGNWTQSYHLLATSMFVAIFNSQGKYGKQYTRSYTIQEVSECIAIITTLYLNKLPTTKSNKTGIETYQGLIEHIQRDVLSAKYSEVLKTLGVQVEGGKVLNIRPRGELGLKVLKMIDESQLNWDPKEKIFKDPFIYIEGEYKKYYDSGVSVILQGWVEEEIKAELSRQIAERENAWKSKEHPPEAEEW